VAILTIVIFAGRRGRLFPGMRFNLVVVLYAVLRFMVDMTRHYEGSGKLGVLSHNQVVTLVLLAVFSLLALRILREGPGVAEVKQGRNWRKGGPSASSARRPEARQGKSVGQETRTNSRPRKTASRRGFVAPVGGSTPPAGRPRPSSPSSSVPPTPTRSPRSTPRNDLDQTPQFDPAEPDPIPDDNFGQTRGD